MSATRRTSWTSSSTTSRFKLADDPGLDGNKLIEEFFTRYYGSAAGPMKALYNRIEDLFGNPKYYPPEIQKSLAHQHQTEELAWKWVGTPERVAELQKLMDQAKVAAKTDEERQRVSLFEKGIWIPITEGRRKYESHQVGRQAPPVVVPVPKVPEAAGDAALVDWSQVKDLGGWGGLAGDPTDQKFETRVAHDARFVYLQLVHLVNPKSLGSGPSVYDGDDWELFFAAERGGSYRQLCVAPNGKVFEKGWKPDAEWKSAVAVKSDTTAADRWTVSLAPPDRQPDAEGRRRGQVLRQLLPQRRRCGATPRLDAALRQRLPRHDSPGGVRPEVVPSRSGGRRGPSQ